MIKLKRACRTLFKTPFVTVIAIISLALGIGANAAIFSVFNQMLLRPLPVPAPVRLVNLGSPGPKQGSTSCGNAGDCDVVFSYPMFRDLERAQTVFTGLAAHVLFGANLSTGGQTLSGEGELVSGGYFPVLGVQPALGRLLGPDDDRTVGGSLVVVLSHAFWQTQFAASPAVVGTRLIVNGQPMTIVGVAAAGFAGTTLGSRPAVFVPITLRGLMQPNFKGFDDRKSYWAYLFARLTPGVSIDQARAALNVPYRALLNEIDAPLQKMSGQTLARFKARQLTIEDGSRGQSTAPGQARQPLTLLLGVTALVLLIACANIANLLVVRAAARAGEMAIRLSLGASRWQLVSQLLTESCLLAVFGGAAGLLVAQWTLALIGSLLPAEPAAAIALQIDRPALIFAGVLTIGTGLLFGLFPALHSTRPDLVSALKGQAGQPSGTRTAARFRTSLATTQIALSMALLVSAGLFTRSLINVSRVDLGLDIDHVVTFAISPNLSGYQPARAQALFTRLEQELAALPGVTGASASMVRLLSGSNWGSSVSVQGYQADPDTDTHASFNEVSAGYFRTLGIPLLAGRDFTDTDAASAPKVAIVNEAFAKKFNLGRDAVGKRMNSGRSGALDTEIVGLVQNAKYSEVKAEIPPLFFRPYHQDPEVGSINFYVRAAGDAAPILAAIPRLVAGLDANLPVENLRTLPQEARENVFLDRFISVLSAAFAVLATLLAAVGLYGVLAYTVTQRTREIGLRMALGATPSSVRGMILRQVGRMTLIGGTIGLLAAAGLGRLAESLLYQLKGSDPVVLIGSAVTLTVVALAAGLVPAQRAARVDPMRALKYE
ncbi:MAG: ABC transporter permease [Acidobacteriota bacterium]